MAGVARGELLEEGKRPVPASVVHVDDLELPVETDEFGSHVVMETGEDVLFVEARDDDREQHADHDNGAR